MGIVISHCKDPGLNNQYYGVDRWIAPWFKEKSKVKPGWDYGLGGGNSNIVFIFIPIPGGMIQFD